eukprot:gene40091-52962_t
MTETKTWMCLICGWIYDEAQGAPEHGVPVGTPWAQVPMNWTCPECGARKEDFEMAGHGSGLQVTCVPLPDPSSGACEPNTIRRSAEIFLKQGGHEVLLADDGFDALAKINDYQPDLVFCDILMPRLDGYQTCAIIKRNVRFANIPVVMLSSKDGVFDKARGRMVGSQDYLTKPFTKDQLLHAVQQFGANLAGAA